MTILLLRLTEGYTRDDPIELLLSLFVYHVGSGTQDFLESRWGTGFLRFLRLIKIRRNESDTYNELS